MAWLLYENIFENGTLASSGDADGFPKENVIDWRVGTPYRWKSSLAASGTHRIEVNYGSNILPDTLCVGGHNQGSPGQAWRLRRGASSPPSTVVESVTSGNLTDPHHVTFSSTTSQYWDWKRDGSGSDVPEFGVVTLGRRVDLDRLPLTVDVYGEEPVTDWNMSLNGALLGSNFRYVSKRFVFNFEPAGLLTSTLDTAVPDFMGAIAHMRSKPIWFAPETDTDTDLVYLCRLDGAVSQPFVASTLRRNPTFTLVATAELL